MSIHPQSLFPPRPLPPFPPGRHNNHIPPNIHHLPTLHKRSHHQSPLSSLLPPPDPTSHHTLHHQIPDIGPVALQPRSRRRVSEGVVLGGGAQGGKRGGGHPPVVGVTLR